MSEERRANRREHDLGGVGYGLVLAPLVVAVAICAIHLHSEIEGRSDRNRAQGVSLARLLSRLPAEALTRTAAADGPLALVRNSQTNPDFAYVVLAGLDGTALETVAAPGVAPAHGPARSEVASWIGERLVEPAVGDRMVREFHSPVIEAGERVAELRVAFFEPDAGLVLSELSGLAVLALPIFLLGPLSYLAFRRGLRPLAAIREELHGLAVARRFDPLESQARGEVGEFIRGFNEFMTLARSRIHELEQERTGILASSKVVAYQQSRIEAVLGSLPDPTLVLDPDGVPIFATPHLESVLGLETVGVVGQSIVDWCTHGALRSFLVRAGTSSRSTEQLELELESGTGARRFEVTRHTIDSGDGRGEIGTLVTFRDISEVRESQRSQGEFVAHVAHELKSPLHVMSMYGESLLDDEAASEEFRIEASNVIRDEVERLDSLVRSLLSISQIEAGTIAVDRQRMRVQDFLEDCVGAVSRAASKRDITFAVQVPPDSGPLFVDKELLRVAVNNLLTNAIKYNHDGGEVAVVGEDTGSRFEIRVRDGGIGIHEQDLERVFEKFFRSSDPEAQKRGGHGLGLALTQRIVELHGGRISVQSSPGEGSEFAISLRKRAEE